MTFATTLMTRIVAAGATGILAVGGLAIITPAAHATQSVVPVSIAASTSPIGMASLESLPDRCLFGTHGGKGKGCRGGSINDNERLNRATKETGKMYKDAGECAIKGVIKGKGKFGPSQLAGARCGTTKPQGQLLRKELQRRLSF